jgi:hypothetical protein
LELITHVIWVEQTHRLELNQLIKGVEDSLIWVVQTCTGILPIEEEKCNVENWATNSISGETKYSHIPLERGKNILTIASRDIMICYYHIPFGIGSIKDVLIYPNLSYQIIEISIMWKHKVIVMDIAYVSQKHFLWTVFYIHPLIQSVAFVITFQVMILTMLGKTELVIPLLGWNEKLWTILLVMFFP